MRMESCTPIESVQPLILNGVVGNDEDTDNATQENLSNGHGNHHLNIQFDKGIGAPTAVLLTRPNSHPFQERRCTLFNAAKVGRAVAKCKPTGDNAIFDCKVLSRNHASLWFEDGKFYLQDTRSSNGTFVNSQRLSNANEESPPKEVYSGDIVQFGVDVIENSRRVTHGCVIATLKLYHPDGTEATPLVEEFNNASGLSGSGGFGLNGSVSSHNLASISTLNLYQLAQSLKEAVDREEALQTKLIELKQILDSAQNRAQSSWQSLVEEDRLLSRIESLQNKLEAVMTSVGNRGEEDLMKVLRHELIKMHEEREIYEIVAKESLQRAAEQTLMTANQLYELDVAFKSAKEERDRFMADAENTAAEMADLAEKYDKKMQELDELHDKLCGVETCLASTDELLKSERLRFEEQLTECSMKEEDLETTVRSLEQLNESLHNQVEELQREIERVANEKAKVVSEQATITGQLSLSQKELDTREERIRDLASQVDKMEQQLLASTKSSSRSEESGDDTSASLTNGVDKEQLQAAIHVDKLESTKSESSGDSTQISQLKSEIELLKELLAEARAAKVGLEKSSALHSFQVVELNKKFDGKLQELDNLNKKLVTVESGLLSSEEQKSARLKVEASLAESLKKEKQFVATIASLEQAKKSLQSQAEELHGKVKKLTTDRAKEENEKTRTLAEQLAGAQKELKQRSDRVEELTLQVVKLQEEQQKLMKLPPLTVDSSKVAPLSSSPPESTVDIKLVKSDRETNTQREHDDASGDSAKKQISQLESEMKCLRRKSTDMLVINYFLVICIASLLYYYM